MWGDACAEIHRPRSGQPAVVAAGPEGGKFMQNLTQVAKLAVIFPIVLVISLACMAIARYV